MILQILTLEVVVVVAVIFINMINGKKYKVNSNLMMSLLFAAQKLKDQEKPEPGYTPKKGEDYFTEKEKREIIDEIIKTITPIKNVDYFDG